MSWSPRLGARLVALVGVTLGFVSGLLPGTPPALGATFTPTRFDDPPAGGCDPSDCSLREAIIAANAAAGPDTISLQPGTYMLQIPGTNEDAAVDGDLDITGDVTLTGAGRESTVIDGNGSTTGERVFDIDPVAPGTSPIVTISAMTIRGGKTSMFIGGGGIHNANLGRLTLVDVLVTANQSVGHGGGIWNEDQGTMTIQSSSVSGNISEDVGGIANWNDAILTVADSTVTGNMSAGLAGGILIWNESKVSITNTTVSGNTAADLGGGILIWNDTTVSITDTTVSANTAGTDGGGILVWNDANVTVTNVTVSGNKAEENGGGLYARNQPIVKLLNVTATGNTADSDVGGIPGAGGGIYVLPGFAGTYTLTNSVVAANHDPTSDPDCSGTFTSGGHNLIGQVSPGCTFSPGPGDLSNVDAKLGPLADNGGLTQTHALGKGSPAIDAGGTDCASTDQRGIARKTCDIGAYELVFCRKVPVNRIGTSKKDSLTGTPKKDGILAFGGKDKLRGKGGSDGLCGGPGKDVLRGGSGKDRLDGGPGKDVCLGQAGKDKAKACEQEKSIP